MENSKTVLRSQQRFRSEAHNVFTENVNKIVRSGNDDRKIQMPDGVTTHTYSYGSRMFRVEFLDYAKIKIGYNDCI